MPIAYRPQTSQLHLWHKPARLVPMQEASRGTDSQETGRQQAGKQGGRQTGKQADPQTGNWTHCFALPTGLPRRNEKERGQEAQTESIGESADEGKIRAREEGGGPPPGCGQDACEVARDDIVSPQHVVLMAAGVLLDEQRVGHVVQVVCRRAAGRRGRSGHQQGLELQNPW